MLMIGGSLVHISVELEASFASSVFDTLVEYLGIVVLGISLCRVSLSLSLSCHYSYLVHILSVVFGRVFSSFPRSMFIFL